jgi:hypothetical protein
MHSNKSGVAAAVAIMALGVAWLLNNVGVMPAVEWVWTLGLAVAGIMIVALLGLDKVTSVIGPFLVIGSFFSILRQAGTIPIHYEVPILVILLGVLLLVAVLSPLKSASWLFEEEKRQ